MKLEEVIKDYIVVVAHDRITELEERVKSYIKIGWEPIGSITVKEFNSGTSYYQPMIKREANND